MELQQIRGNKLLCCNIRPREVVNYNISREFSLLVVIEAYFRGGITTDSRKRAFVLYFALKNCPLSKFESSIFRNGQ